MSAVRDVGGVGASGSTVLTERAPAKVNLTLHVLGRRFDGWHELESLVAFTGCGDTLTLEPARGVRLEVVGPSAAAAGPDNDNLVLRAARNLLSLSPGLQVGAFRLTKRLPAAAGLGGGSSDAAAALRLIARANGLPFSDERLFRAAQQTGADVPVCLEARARFMKGVGERLEPALSLPPLFAVLVNPRVSLETRAVFAAMRLAPGQRSVRNAGFEVSVKTSEELIARLRDGGNDMEAAACALEPTVLRVLGVLADTRGARLARMSGSGATCFALFDSRPEASCAATALRSAQPSWWIRAALLR